MLECSVKRKRKVNRKKKKTQEWWDKDCRKAKKEMKRTLRKWKKHNHDIGTYKKKKKEYLQMFM